MKGGGRVCEVLHSSAVQKQAGLRDYDGSKHEVQRRRCISRGFESEGGKL